MFRKILKSIFFYELKKVENLRNKHESQTAYLIGNGASLKFVELEKLKNHLSIGLNWIIFHKDFKKINCKYVLYYDPTFYIKSIPSFMKKFLRRHGYEFGDRELLKFMHSNMTKLQIINIMNITNYFDYKDSSTIFTLGPMPFNWPINKNPISQNKLTKFSYGSLQLQIQLAIYLGFSKVYLIGHDYLEIEPKIGHWYEDMIDEEMSHKNWNKEYIQEANKFIEIAIINKSGQSYVDVATYSFKDYFNLKIQNSGFSYKEIVEPEALLKLKKQNKYKID